MSSVIRIHIAHIHYLHEKDDLQILTGSFRTHISAIDFVIKQLALSFRMELDGLVLKLEQDLLRELHAITTQVGFNNWIEKAFGVKDFMKVVIECQ